MKKDVRSILLVSSEMLGRDAGTPSPHPLLYPSSEDLPVPGWV